MSTQPWNTKVQNASQTSPENIPTSTAKQRRLDLATGRCKMLESMIQLFFYHLPVFAKDEGVGILETMWPIFNMGIDAIDPLRGIFKNGSPPNMPVSAMEEPTSTKQRMLLGKSSKPEEREPIIPFQQAGIEAIHVRQAIILWSTKCGIWTLVALLGRNLYSEV
nr:hypothetical protein Iba_chr12fCG12550 [Ipomoea batatas]